MPKKPATPRRTKTIKDRALPLDLPQPTAKPHGEILDTTKPYTLPLNNEIPLTRVIGRYTEIDRKVWVTLAAMAWDNLDKKSIHEGNLRDIARLFRELKSGADGIEWLMDSARRLLDSRMDWEDEDEVGTATLLSGLKIVKSTGRFYYQFPDFLIDKLLDNGQFSRLRLHFMIGLSGKYSVALYMILEAAANRQHPVIELTIDELRDALSVPKGKLLPWIHLKQRALDLALKEISNNPMGAGFSVEFETITRGRKVEGVRFTVKKTHERKMIESNFKPFKIVPSSPAPATGITPDLDIDRALEAIRKNAPGADAQCWLTEWTEWAAEQPPASNPMGALIAWTRNKYERDGYRLGLR
jgi:hypothetical protein